VCVCVCVCVCVFMPVLVLVRSVDNAGVGDVVAPAHVLVAAYTYQDIYI